MKKRKWSNIKIVGPEIIKMCKEGRTRQEMADALGLEKVQIKNWISRYNREQRHLAARLLPKWKERSRRSGYTAIEECQYEIQRLKMENELLWDFRADHPNSK